MRKANAIISMLLLVLFILHMIAGGFQLAGWLRGGIVLLSRAARIMACLLLVHMLIGIILTIRTYRAIRRAGVSYTGANKRFWISRISGFAIFLFMLPHLMLFSGGGDPARLSYFGTVELLSQLGMVLSLALHLCFNIKPLGLALGLDSIKEVWIDVFLVLSILLILAGAAFVVYFFRWQLI